MARTWLPAPDDSHASLSWDPEWRRSSASRSAAACGSACAWRCTSWCSPRNRAATHCPLTGKPDAEVGNWLDRKLAAEGLKPASGANLPYEMPSTMFARAGEEALRFPAIALWFAAAAEALEELRQKYRRYKPGPSPVRCWPHHFDIAILVALEEGPRRIRALDRHRRLAGRRLLRPALPVREPVPEAGHRQPPAAAAGQARWHTKDFFGAVATGNRPARAPRPARGVHQDRRRRICGKPAQARAATSCANKKPRGRGVSSDGAQALRPGQVA